MTQFDMTDLDDPFMPFGKYGPNGTEGHCRLSAVPDNYLLWLLELAEADKLYPSWLSQCVIDEWRKRKNGK